MAKNPKTRAQNGVPNLQSKPRQWQWRKFFSVWIQELPVFRFQPQEPDPKFQLITDECWKKVSQRIEVDENAKQKIEEDIEFLDYELLRMFRQRDNEASKQQNRYRLYQIGFMVLAGIATMIGSFQALALSDDPASLPKWAFIETLVALLATFLATISGRESPLPIWLNNRHRAESLRREYFRYLLNLPPYDEIDGYQRKMTLSKRAANINRGMFPEEPIVD